MPYPNEDTPLLLLLVLAERHVVNALQGHLVEAGFSDHRAVHHTVMAHVTFDGIRLTELAKRAGVTKQAMSELVSDLVALGYLETRPDPLDGRAKLITFAARGADAVRAANRTFEDLDRALKNQLGPRALRDLRRGLLGVVDATLSAS